MQGVITQLRNKANKKCNFRLFSNIDRESIMRKQVEQYKLDELNIKQMRNQDLSGSVSHDKLKKQSQNPNLQFAVSESANPLGKMPMKPVNIVNNIIGVSNKVQPPDMIIEPLNSYELGYFKNLSKGENPFNKKAGEFAVV